MEAFTYYQGKTMPLMDDNIDTDQILPKNYLKRVEKTGFGKYLFDDWRYLEKRQPNPDFILNFPEYQAASILITGDNFGSGSSREHAAWALMDYGFRAVIAGSFSDIFYMNATKNGLLPIVLPLTIRQKLAVLSPKEEISIDLSRQQVTINQVSYPFEIDATWKHKLVNGLDEIGITLQEVAKISAYEKTIPAYRLSK
jgi:3-isopropylmalate/(R)-2-methylmalate dehydratase small subunit